MFQMYFMRVAALTVFIAVGSAFAGTVTMDQAVSAQGTFLALSSNDNCSSLLAAPGCSPSNFTPTYVDVSGLDGMTINILGQGTICYFGANDCTPSPSDLLGVFSSSNTLTPADYIASSLPEVVSSTYFGDMNNTVTQDFQIAETGGTEVVVPVGANWLIVGVLDSFYADNTSTDPSVQVSYESQTSVPEPTSYAMVLGGIAGLAAFSRYRLHR